MGLSDNLFNRRNKNKNGKPNSDEAVAPETQAAGSTVKKKLISFKELLSLTQEFMSKQYAASLYDGDKKDMVKQYIKQFIKDNNYYVQGKILADVADELYVEMAEYSFLTPFLNRKDIEEINVNAWNDIAVHPTGGKAYKLNERFMSPSHAVDVIKRLLRNSKIVFDASKPIVTGYLGSNTRITAVHSAIVGDEAGVSASIRLVNPQKIGREQFIQGETCTEDMHAFLCDCFKYGVSQCYAGGTGSGKTTFMADIMSYYPDYKRLITIEKSVREFDLRKHGENGEVINNIVHLVTRDSDDASRSVTILQLETACLTMHPDAICVSEMKNEEAWEAIESARTGHTVMTTVHASSTEGIYKRLATLCLQKYSELPYSQIIDFACEAFPISIFLEQLGDGKRHLMEIAECEYLGDGKYRTIPLWVYEVREEKRDNETGAVTINGGFVRRNSISKNLQKWMLRKGMPQTALNKYI